MNITVYCGANAGTNVKFKETAKALGKWIVENGHSLVYGGAKVGLMGLVANEVLAQNGEVIGVMPTFLASKERVHDNLTNLEIVDSMSERKNKMIELGDCYIALPGGPGTLEEIAEVISWARIGQHQNPCILINVDSYYDHLQALFDHMVDNGFLTKTDREMIVFVRSIEELENYIQSI